jgi:hypothetical protein
MRPETIAALTAAAERAQERQKAMIDSIAPHLEAATKYAQQLAADVPDVPDLQPQQIAPHVPGPAAVGANALLELVEVERQQSASMQKMVDSLRELGDDAIEESTRSKWTLRILVVATALSLAGLIVSLVHL